MAEQRNTFAPAQRLESSVQEDFDFDKSLGRISQVSRGAEQQKNSIPLPPSQNVEMSSIEYFAS